TRRLRPVAERHVPAAGVGTEALKRSDRLAGESDRCLHLVRIGAVDADDLASRSLVSAAAGQEGADAVVRGEEENQRDVRLRRVAEVIAVLDQEVAEARPVA